MAFLYYMLWFIANTLCKYAIVFFLDLILDPLLGKDEVAGSNPANSSKENHQIWWFFLDIKKNHAIVAWFEKG